MNDESLTMEKMSDDFINKFKHNEIFKQKEVDHVGKGVLNPENPIVLLYEQCMQNSDVLMPVLEKLHNMTLCLQEYPLSDGCQAGLAQAMRFLDNNKFQKLFLDKCGITGKHFAEMT